MYNSFILKAVARIRKQHSNAMLGLVLEFPEEVKRYLGVRYWVVYGNACYQCRDREEVSAVCEKRGWAVHYAQDVCENE